ncbi:hypothetical protein Tco_1001056 [Tanacetum coccineum]
MSKVLQERGFVNLPSSSKTNPRDHVKSISTTVETDTTLIRRIRPSRYVVSGPQNCMLFFVPSQATILFPSRLHNDCCDEEEGSYRLKDMDAYSIGTTFLDDDLPIKEKDSESFTLPCIINNLCFNKSLANLGASVSVMPFSTYTKLGLGGLDPTNSEMLLQEAFEIGAVYPRSAARRFAALLLDDLLLRCEVRAMTFVHCGRSCFRLQKFRVVWCFVISTIFDVSALGSSLKSFFRVADCGRFVGSDPFCAFVGCWSGGGVDFGSWGSDFRLITWHFKNGFNHT